MKNFLSLTGKRKKKRATCKLPSITSQMLFMAPSLLTPCYRHTKNWGFSRHVLPQCPICLTPPVGLCRVFLDSCPITFQLSFHLQRFSGHPRLQALAEGSNHPTSIPVPTSGVQELFYFFCVCVLTQCLSHTHTPHTMQCSGCLNITFWETCDIPSFQ